MQTAPVSKREGPAIRKITPLTRISSTDYLGSESDQQITEYKVVTSVWDTNPDDSSAWEEADVNGAEFGVKVTT